MRKLHVVIDTNILIAALRSPRGVSYQILRLLGSAYFDIHISVPLLLEYESIAKRYLDDLSVNGDDVDDLLDYICTTAQAHQVYYTWRPFLPDPNDEMILEIAVTAGCDGIVTFNKKDFRGCEKFGLQLWSPVELLRKIGVLQ